MTGTTAAFTRNGEFSEEDAADCRPCGGQSSFPISPFHPVEAANMAGLLQVLLKSNSSPVSQVLGYFTTAMLRGRQVISLLQIGLQ